MSHLTDDAFTAKLTNIILKNLDNENFGVKDLAKSAGMSCFNLNRKLHLISGKTINKFIREVRLESAMEMLRMRSRDSFRSRI